MNKKDNLNQDYGGPLANGIGGYAASRLIGAGMALAKWFPRKPYTATAVVAVRLLARLLPGLRRLIAANIAEIREDVAPEELNRAVYENLANTFARKYVDVFFLAQLDKRFVESDIEVAGLEKYNLARSEGRGVLLLTWHVGFFPIMAYLALPHLGGSVLAPFRRIFDERAQEKLRISASAHGARSVHPGGALKAIVAQLRAGETVLMAADHLTSPRGMRVTYFGYETLMPAGPATLACRYQPVTMPCLCVRTETGKFRLEFGDPFTLPKIEGKVNDAQLKEFAQQYIRYFEPFVRRYPEQWECFFPIWPKSFEEEDLRAFYTQYGVVA